MKKFDIKKLKYIIVGVAFLVSLGVAYVLEDYNGRSSQYLAMDMATYPVVMMTTQDGIRYNALHGYAYEMDITKMNSVITPLPADKKLPAVVATYGEEVTGVSYKVRDIVTGELIEETTVRDYTIKNQELSAVLNIKNLVENGSEYMLEVCLSTKKHDKIFYYTKIIAGAYSSISEKLNFVTNFNSYTYNKNELNKIIDWIEPKSGADNTNFGYANINSSLSHIGWGELNPTVASAIIPSINEISGETASITLNYVIAMPADDGTYFSCNINEYYRVRITTRGQYLLNFERKADTVFSSDNDVNATRITMGIRSDDALENATTADGRFIYFVSDGNLWCYNQESREFTKVFSFGAQDVDGIRENYDNHHISIMKVEDNGNAVFAVYGYMNRGTHEGNVGVGVYSYDVENNQVREKLFIPVDVPYDILHRNVGELFYVNPFDVCYMILGNTLYSVDLTSMEYMEEATNLAEGNYAVSRDDTIIAYSGDNNGKAFGSINVFNMEQGGKYIIDAGEGEILRVLDFIDSDLFYGHVKDGDVYSKVDGTSVYPSYKMEVIDKDRNVIKTYSEEGIYVEDTQVSGMRLNIYRLKKTENGFVSTAMDQLLNKDENSVGEIVQVGSIATDKWKKELVLNIKKTYPATDKIIMRAANEMLFSEDVVLNLNNWQANEALTFYAYGAGRMCGEYETLGEAVNVANRYMGYVAGSNGKIYWRRLKSTSAQVKQLNYEYNVNSLCSSVITLLRKGGYGWNVSGITSGERSIITAINESTSGCGINLCGANVETVLYYIDNQIPVVGRAGDDKYVLVTGYNSDYIFYYDYEKASEITVSYGEAAAIFEAFGNTFFAYWK